MSSSYPRSHGSSSLLSRSSAQACQVGSSEVCYAMSFSLDPDLEAVIGSLLLESGQPLASNAGDWMSLRTWGEAGMAASEASLPPHEDVARTPLAITSFDGSEVSVCWYVPDHRTTTPGPAAVYVHGGGMLMGSLHMSDHYVAGYVADSGVPMLSVDYRLAPEHPHPTPVEDCYAALNWIYTNSEQLAVDRERIAIMGDSAGGGLAAATVLLARDRGLRPAKQILIYPMLDDRTTTPDLQLLPFMSWSYENNELGWRALLGDAAGTATVPGIAAPARAEDLADLPSAYVEVGELDIFRDECLEYTRRLTLAGTSAELHVWPGCPHGFDRISPTADVAIRSRADRIRILKSL